MPCVAFGPDLFRVEETEARGPEVTQPLQGPTWALSHCEPGAGLSLVFQGQDRVQEMEHRY